MECDSDNYKLFCIEELENSFHPGFQMLNKKIYQVIEVFCWDEPIPQNEFNLSLDYNTYNVSVKLK